MEPNGSLSLSKQLTTGPYSEPDTSSPHLPMLLPQDRKTILEWSPPFRFSNQNFISISPLPVNVQNNTWNNVLTERDSHYCLQWDPCCVLDLFVQPHPEPSLQNSLQHPEGNRDCTSSWCYQLSHCMEKNTKYLNRDIIFNNTSRFTVKINDVMSKCFEWCNIMCILIM
jgi:hypothetical protein